VEANTAAEQATEHAKDAETMARTNFESKQQEIVQTKEKFAEDLDSMELKQAAAINGTAAEHRADEEDAIDDAKARVSRHNSTHQNALTSLEMNSKEQAMLRQTTAQDINAKQQALQLASQALEAARDKMTKDSADSEAKSGDLKSLSAKMLRLQSNLEEAVEEEARMTKASQELSSSKISEAQKKVDDARKRETHLNGMMQTAQTSFDGVQAAADKSQEIADTLKEELDLKTQEAAAKLAKAEEALSKLQPEDGEKTKGGKCQITMQANPQKPIVEERECTDPQDKLPFRCCNDEGTKTQMTPEKRVLGEGHSGALAMGGDLALGGGGYGCHKGNVVEAEQVCSEAGYRLCSEAEMNECQQCDTGCMLDLKRIWTSASETQEENEDITQAKEKVQSKKLALDEAKINERKQNQAKQESVTDLRNDAATTQKELTEVQTDFNGATEEMRDAGKALQTVISKTNDAMERMAEEPSAVKELEQQVSQLKKQVKLATVVADEARARQQAADKLAESSLAEEKDALRNKEQAETLADTQLERAASKISDAREDAGARHEEMKAAIKQEEELEIKRAKENAAELEDVKTDFAQRERTLRTEYQEKFNTKGAELTTLRANEVEAKVTTEKAELQMANTFTIHNVTVSRADQDVAAAQAKLDRASGAAMTASKLQDDAELVADNFQTELEGQFMKIGAKDSEDALSVLGHKLQLAEQAVATLKANQAAHKKQDEEASGGVANALEAKQESVTKMNSIQEMELQAVALANTRTALAEKQLSEARSRKTAEFTAMAV